MMVNVNQFCFSRATYSDLLEALSKSGYGFSTFSQEVDRLPSNSSGRRCLLRHDIDISMDYALDMAQLERLHNVSSTYFLMLRSPMYNLMSRHAKSVMENLANLGHEIGLHFDGGSSRRKGMTLEEDIQFEINMLSGLLGRHVRAFSFHQPSEEAIRLQIEIPGVINTYHPSQLPGYKYISDSNRDWREKDPFEFVTQGFDRLQILTHPIWWMCEEAQTIDCWDRAIERNFDSAQHQMLETERAYGPARRLKISRTSNDEGR